MDRQKGKKRTVTEEELEERLFGSSFTVAPEKTKTKKSKKERETEPVWEDVYDQDDEEIRRQMLTPSWAKRKAQKAEDDDELMRRTGDTKVASTTLPDTILQLKLCTDLNKDNHAKGKLTAVEFHPWAKVAMAGSMGQRLCIFEVDGKRNPCLTSLFIDKYPIYSAHFTTDGNEIVMGSRHRNFKVFDLNAGKILEVPCLKSMEETNMKRLHMSPDGQTMVFPGSYGNMHIFSQKSKQWIDTVKMNGEVETVAFSPDGSRMFSHGWTEARHCASHVIKRPSLLVYIHPSKDRVSMADGEVYVFDMERRSCIHRFLDDGCLTGLSLAVSPDGNYLATGSSRAAVNLYEVGQCMASKTPKPSKVFLNLRYQVTGLTFNPSSEILAMTSNYAENAIRLAHISSRTVFSNFPEPHTKTVRIPFSTAFSKNSGYMAIGLHTGRALLYRLKHYSSY